MENFVHHAANPGPVFFERGVLDALCAGLIASDPERERVEPPEFAPEPILSGRLEEALPSPKPPRQGQSVAVPGRSGADF
jgi:hypothetical protein